MADNLIVPDGPAAGDPLILTRDQAAFVLRLYEISPATGMRIRRRAVFSRAKSSGKSPLVAGLALAEALAPVVPAGWDAEGQPVGKPWAELGFKPKVQIVAVSEAQTINTWEPLLGMAREGPVARNYRIDPMETFVVVPRGRIEFVTSNSTSREGFRPVFSALDQTESWNSSNGGVRLAGTVRRNLAKTGGCSVETPNAYRPGMGSVAEKTHEAVKLGLEGRVKGDPAGILWDHREMPADTDVTDRQSLLEGLAFAYGCSAARPGVGCALHGRTCDVGWVDLDRIVQEFWDPASDPSDSRMFWGGQITSASDSWLTQPEVAAVADATKVIADRDVITLGFDGSRSRTHSVTDATALVGCRVVDGHLFPIGVWEQPEGPMGIGWSVPAIEVDATVRDAFDRYSVVGFYADPSKWETWVAAWEADFGDRLQVKATRDHPVEWWMIGGRLAMVVRALAQFHSAVIDKELTFDGSSVLVRHLLNARRRPTRSGLTIAKEYPESPRKIDAAVAATLAWQARLDAVAAGINEPTATKPRSRRLYRF